MFLQQTDKYEKAAAAGLARRQQGLPESGPAQYVGDEERRLKHQEIIFKKDRSHKSVPKIYEFEGRAEELVAVRERIDGGHVRLLSGLGHKRNCVRLRRAPAAINAENGNRRLPNVVRVPTPEAAIHGYRQAVDEE